MSNSLLRMASLALLSVLPTVVTAQTETSGPMVGEPVTPQQQTRDLRQQAEPIGTWRPGDPVQEVGDLIESAAAESGKPKVRPPVAPQVQERPVNRPPEEVKTWRPGEPVRQVDDLKEQPPAEGKQ